MHVAVLAWTMHSSHCLLLSVADRELGLRVAATDSRWHWEECVVHASIAASMQGAPARENTAAVPWHRCTGLD